MSGNTKRRALDQKIPGASDDRILNYMRQKGWLQ